MKTNPVLPSVLIVLVLLTISTYATDLAWIGGTGNWNAAGNWNPAQVPTAADNVWITNNGTYTITIPAGTTANCSSLTLGASSGTQTLAIDRATFTLNGPGLVNANGQLNWLVSQSVLTGPGNLVVNGSLNWPNGTMSGAGLTTVNPSGVVAVGSGGVTLGRNLNNSGTVSWAGGNFTFSAGISLNNQFGGLFDITADGRLSGASTTPINNSGLLRQVAGSVSTIITAPVNNSGTVQVLAATLSINLGGSHSGIFSNAPAASLNFGGGNHALNSGSLVTGAGVLSLSGGATLAASSTFNPGTTLNVSSGIATLNSACDVSVATLSISGNGGIVLFNSLGTVGSVSLSAGTLGGTSPVRVSGPLTLSGGTVTNALVFANGGLAVTGNTTLNGAKLVNPGIALWSGGNITGANGAAISNLLGATFINTFDGNAATGAGVTPTFFNAGTFAKTNGTAAAGATSIDFQFLNVGTVEVRTNTLRYASNQQTAGLTLLDGGDLAAQAQPLQFLGGSLVGTGLVTVANLQNVINSASISPGSPLGQLDISGNYQQTASGALNIDLGGYTPGIDFDFVTVSAGGAGGVANLGGTLNIALANGFSPTNGATFIFLTASSRVGAFATFNYPSNDLGMEVTYGASSAQVRVTNLKPVVANAIAGPAPITYGGVFSLQFPANTFTDPDGDLLTYVASGLPVGISFNPETRTFSGTAAQAGTFPVIVTATDAGTPRLSVTNGFTLTINPAPLTITAQGKSKPYGAADPELTYAVSGLLLGDTPAGVLTGAVTRNPGETVAGSPYVITQGTLAANSNYHLTFTSAALSITPASLSITADAKTKTYGSTDPAFTVTYLGFMNGETTASLSGALIFNRASGESVGTYSITPSGQTSTNYSLTFNPGNLTITKATLTVTAENSSKTYGSADPAFTARYAGFVNGDSAAALGGTLAFSRAPGENVGTYAITPSGLTSGNYQIAFNAGTLSVMQAPLSVTAENKTKIYGASDPAFTAAYSGFVRGDTSTALGGTLSFTRAPGENAGSYAITPGGLTGTNYTITFHVGSLSITQARLAVTADNKTKAYGAADPVFTVNYSGLTNGDTVAVLGGTLAFTRAPGENVGSYPITPSGLTSANYTISFNPGSLTITQAALAVRAEDKTKIYGAVDPAFTVSFAGFVNGDTVAVLSGTLAFTRAPGENVGNYAITPAGYANPNYIISFNAGTLSILRAPLSITADGKSKTYGSIDPIFTVSYSGFVNGESPAVLGGTLGIVRTTGENVGSYTITPSGFTSANYALTFSTGTLTITRAALSVNADAKTKTYGAADPAFSATYGGFVNGETPAVLGGTLVFTRAPGENVASYLITPSGLTSGNYLITFNTGTLSITRATLSITAAAKSKTYGAADPALTFTLSGLQFSDTQTSVLSGALVRAPGESVAGSPYAITQGTLVANSNYSINFTPNSLAITPAPLLVTADSKTKVFGTTDPVFTVTDSGFVNGETSAVLGGTLAITRTPGENVGTYAITPAGLTSSNYRITFTPGTLTITAPAPAILSLTRSGLAEVTLTWSSVSNATYRVQFVPSLNSTGWTDLPGDVLASSSTASRTDVLTTTNRFYRIRVLP